MFYVVFDIWVASFFCELCDVMKIMEERFRCDWCSFYGKMATLGTLEAQSFSAT